MIVAKQKPIEEITEALKDYEKILIAGCNECVTVCEAGGKKEVAVLYEPPPNASIECSIHQI